MLRRRNRGVGEGYRWMRSWYGTCAKLGSKRHRATSSSESTSLGSGMHEPGGVNLRVLVELAGVPKPYMTEIRKGMRLADYVSIK